MSPIIDGLSSMHRMLVGAIYVIALRGGREVYAYLGYTTCHMEDIKAIISFLSSSSKKNNLLYNAIMAINIVCN